MSRHSRQQGPTVYLLVEIRKKSQLSGEMRLIRGAIHQLEQEHGFLVTDVPFIPEHDRYQTRGWADCHAIMRRLRVQIQSHPRFGAPTRGKHRKEDAA